MIIKNCLNRCVKAAPYVLFGGQSSNSGEVTKVLRPVVDLLEKE